ncbi:glycosyltransferase family 2 protein [Algoriphagus antarcticus]|uniref:Dolichol-phosphate mannosyltransferase n=1 Tax=Algoriphagus antarcticus TaxID=238540 RepID=A0A3E0DNZ1_9BACT|nr:glycosyltransferase family 2 protein [Algoriphagus antarcticus]REG84433.1 dolichol-phosphate mannosyltransferase [Algoriphagus antarcticus]
MVFDSDIQVCLLFPCFNEEENFELLLLKIIPFISNYKYSILFVDDGSTDHTREKLYDLASKNSRINYISFSRNFGHQNALKAGYRHSKGADVVITMDADLQHPPELIPELLEKWKQGHKVVNTIRNPDPNTSFFKRTSSRLFYKLYGFITGTKLVPGSSDFRLLDKSVVKVINSLPESSPFIRGMISWVGFKQISVEYTAAQRTNGKSGYTLVKMVNLAISGITSFGISPIRVSFLAGSLCSFLAFLYGIYAVAVHSLTDKTVIGWTSVIASVLFLSGFQLIMIGVIGEYIGKIHIQSRKRPDYIIEESTI